MGDNFLSKSFLFEIVDSTTEIIERSFTLVLPPQSYSIREKHRVNITKTFGNAFIDDYGADNLELVIKGISGTAHVFPTFRTSGVSRGGATFDSTRVLQGNVFPAEGYRHKEAFYTFRDDIMRYRDRAKFDQKELRVYDLADEQAYKCVLIEFSLERTSERPFHYPFTISLFVYAKMGSKEAYRPRKVDIAKNPTQSLNNLDEANVSVQKRFRAFDNVQNLRNQLALLANQTKILRAKFNTWLLETRTVIESPLIVTKQLIDIMMTALGFLYDAYTQAKISYDNWTGAVETIENEIREGLGIYGFSIQEGSQQTKEESVDKYTGMSYSNVDNPSPTSSLETFRFSGVNLYTVRGGDTLQSIAQDQLGDEDLWVYIASINKDIRSNDDLIVGDKIYIPVSVDTGALNKDSFILTEDTLRDPYGADIRLDSDGNIVLLESNDVALISGVDNVLQAVDMMMNTPLGSMIKQTAHGLISQPGMAGTSQAISYVRMGFISALIKDPRINQVSNVNINVNGDALSISADISLVGREESIPIDVFLD